MFLVIIEKSYKTSNIYNQGAGYLINAFLLYLHSMIKTNTRKNDLP